MFLPILCHVHVQATTIDLSQNISNVIHSTSTYTLSYINTGLSLLRFSNNVLEKCISVCLYACPVSFTLIGREHPGREELVSGAMLWEDIAKQLGQPVTCFLVTTLTATEGQFTNLFLFQNHPMMQFARFVKRMQINSNSSRRLLTDAMLWTPWCN